MVVVRTVSRVKDEDADGENVLDECSKISRDC